MALPCGAVTAGAGPSDSGAARELKRWNDPYWTSVWPKREALTACVTPYLLEHLAPVSGERILDVGPGAGLASLAVAERLGPDGQLVGADISEALVSLASHRATERGLARASFLIADMQNRSIPGGPFDAVASQFGVMFFDQPVKAFANLRTHARPGGRLVFVCWQEMARNPWFTGPALVDFVPPPPTPAPGMSRTGPFALADPAAVRELLSRAGWVDVGHHRHELVATVELDSILDAGQLRFQGVSAASEQDAWHGAMTFLEPLRRPDGRYDAPLAVQVFTARS
jgi:SAM-dependent methyltransferase